MSTNVDSVAYDMAYELGNQYTGVDAELVEHAETAVSTSGGAANAARHAFLERVWEHYTDVLDFEVVYEVTVAQLKADAGTLEMYGFDTEGLETWMNETAYDLFDAFAEYVFDMYGLSLPSRSPHHAVSTSAPVSQSQASMFMTRAVSKELAEAYTG